MTEAHSDGNSPPTADETPEQKIPNYGRRGNPGEEGEGSEGGRGGRGGRGGIGKRGATGGIGKQGKPGSAGGVGPEGPEGERGLRGKTGAKQTKANKWAVSVVVCITALSSIYFAGTAQHQLDEAKDQRRATQEQVTCQNNVLTNTLEALQARSNFAEHQADVALTLNRAQAHWLDSIAQPHVTKAQQVKSFRDYQQALSKNIDATVKSLTIRQFNPYPTIKQIRACQ